MDVISHPEALRDFSVQALDGRVGVVVDADRDALLVRRRPFRRRVTVPARAVVSIDQERRSISLDRTRRQVSRIPQPRTTGRRAWFIPGSNRVSGASNPIIGARPSPDNENEAESP